MFGSTAAMGIDVGAKAVRAAMIQRRGQAVTLQSLVCESYGERPLAEALLAVRRQIRKACKTPLHWPKQQIMGIPQSQVAVKRFPQTRGIPEREQYVQVGLQLSESLGQPMNDLLYDFHPLPEGDGLEVYACRRPVLDNVLDDLAASGFHLSVIELQSHALMRLYRRQADFLRKRSLSLLVDISHERLQLCLGDGHLAYFCRELPTLFGIEAPSDAAARLRNTDALCEAVIRQYQLAQPQLHGAQVEGVGVSGDAAERIDSGVLAQRLGWPVSIINPFIGLQDAVNGASRPPEGASAWAMAVGLALRGVDSVDQY